MPIYIQSRGKKQDQDYRWLRIKENEYYPQNPDFLLQPISSSIRSIDLIESQKLSIILVATEDRYYLLVTGLKARPERTDFAGRLVRNSILWDCTKDNELKIRSLLILALRGELDREIDKSINIGSEYGFKVDYDRLEHLSNLIDLKNNQNTDLNCKIGKNCVSLREELALELENNLLPNKTGLLVLVTSIKSASTLKQTVVWRGLSNRIEFEEFKRYATLGTTKSEAEKKTILLGIAIAILIIAIALVIKSNTPQTQPEITPTPSTTQENSSYTSTKKLNLSVNPTKAKEINYSSFSYIFNEESGT